MLLYRQLIFALGASFILGNVAMPVMAAERLSPWAAWERYLDDFGGKQDETNRQQLEAFASRPPRQPHKCGTGLMFEKYHDILASVQIPGLPGEPVVSLRPQIEACVFNPPGVVEFAARPELSLMLVDDYRRAGELDKLRSKLEFALDHWPELAEVRQWQSLPAFALPTAEAPDAAARDRAIEPLKQPLAESERERAMKPSALSVVQQYLDLIAVFEKEGAAALVRHFDGSPMMYDYTSAPPWQTNKAVALALERPDQSRESLLTLVREMTAKGNNAGDLWALVVLARLGEAAIIPQVEVRAAREGNIHALTSLFHVMAELGSAEARQVVARFAAEGSGNRPLAANKMLGRFK